VFNLLGPLANPAGVRRQVIGVARPEHVRRVAEALRELGSEHALVLHGAGGADELTLAGENLICELRAGELHDITLDARELDLDPAPVEALAGGDAAENARITQAVLGGAHGAQRDVVALNAAAAIYVGGRARDLKEGLAIAQDAIDSGRGAECLRQLAAFGRQELVG
jgi:anthranilate phosphoribosyltransferase